MAPFPFFSIDTRLLQQDGRGLKAAIVMVFLLAFGATELATWLLFVPGYLSPSTFVWMTAAALLVITFAGVTAANARATRSIAHVLYEVEHPGTRRG